MPAPVKLGGDVWLMGVGLGQVVTNFQSRWDMRVRTSAPSAHMSQRCGSFPALAGVDRRLAAIY